MTISSLGTGSALVAYKVVAALGAGGMGEVWRAEDSRLGGVLALGATDESGVVRPALREFCGGGLSLGSNAYVNRLSMHAKGPVR